MVMRPVSYKAEPVKGIEIFLICTAMRPNRLMLQMQTEPFIHTNEI